MANNIKCTCGHSWSRASSSGKDMYVCHICGKDNTMEDGGWLNKYEQGGLVLKKKTKDNYDLKFNPNDVEASVGPGFVGDGYNTKGRNYSPAWGGQFQDGGNLFNTNKTAWVDSIHNARKGDLNFVQRMFDRSAGSIQIPGEKGTSTHFMESGDGKAYPTVVQMPNGKLQYLNQNDKDAAWNYANKTGQFIKFPNDEQAAWYADNGYKKGTNVLKKAMGGSMPGAVGFMYARTQDPAPSNGKYAKKTKASAQNGKKLIDFGFSAPESDNTYEGDVTFFNPKDFEGIRGKVENYMRSDTYLNRLKNYVPDEQFARRVRDARANSVGSVELSKTNPGNEIGYYGNDRNPGMAQVNADHSIKYNDKTTRGILGHEIGHAAFRGLLTDQTDKFDKSALILNPNERQALLTGLKTDELYKNLGERASDEHYTTGGGKWNKGATGETYGDLTGLRLILNDSGITKNFGDQLTPEMFKKALQNPKTKNDPVLRRMKMKFSDEDIVRMNNTVADNNSYKSNKAQSGISTPPKNSTLKRIDDVKSSIQASQDAKTLSKSEYEAKYKGTRFDNYKWWKDDDVAGWENQVKNLQKNYDASVARQKAAEQAAIDLANKQKAERLEKEKFVNEYSTKQSEFDKFKSDVASKYNYTPGEQILGPREAIVKRMVDEANKAIDTGIGYDLPQLPGNEMTCINGICEIASTAGVDFSGMEGVTGVRKNPYTGKLIPQYNAGWAANDNYKKAGYTKLAEGEIPQVGDLAQYTDDGKIHHMELVLGSDKGGINTYNNYQQTLTPTPGAGRTRRDFNNNPNQMRTGAGTERTVYYRLDPSVEQKIYETNPEYSGKAKGKQQFESSDDFKKYNEYQDYINKQAGTYNQYKDYLGKLPKSKDGSVIKDDRGQWAHPGEITEIGSNNITMQGVDYPVLGISDMGDVQMMYPGEDYNFDGNKVIEFPMMKSGGWLDKFQPGGKLPKPTLTESYPSTSITTGVKSGTRKATSKNLSQKEVKQIEEEDRLNKYLENRGEIRAAEAPRSALSKAWAVLSNPVTAAQYVIAGRGLPEHFDRGPLNPIEHATNIINPLSFVNAVADVPEAGYEFIKDPSLGTGVRLGGDLLQAVPLVSGVAGGAATMAEELSPFLKKGMKTYKATSDIPSAYNRLRNAIYSGSTAQELPGDMMHHAYFRMTPEQVTAKIAAEKAGSPAGAMLGDLNMSINSTPLYFTNATREAKAFTPVRTGEMQPTNSFGWRGKRVEDAIPFEIKQKYGKELSEFKKNQLDWESKIKNAAPEDRERLMLEKLAYEEDNNPIKTMLDYARREEPDSYKKFIQNYKPEMDRPIERLNNATGLNFPMSKVTDYDWGPGFYETPTAISIKNPNVRVKSILESVGKKGLKEFNEKSGLKALSEFNPGDIRAANKLKKERINSINEDYQRSLNNLDSELTGEDRLFEENYLRDIRDNEISGVERSSSKQYLQRQRARDEQVYEGQRQNMSMVIRELMQDQGVIPDRSFIERITGSRNRIRMNDLDNNQLRLILDHLHDVRRNNAPPDLDLPF
jgi:hypothetical protein